MRLFKRKIEAEPSQPTDVETVQARIAECDARILDAEGKLRQTSLAAVLGDSTEGEAAARQLQALRDRRELLGLALTEAQRIEVERQNAARYREWQARRRALSQQTGRIERAARDVTAAMQEVHKAQQAMEECGAAISSLLPRSLQSDAKPWNQLFSPAVLGDLAQLERFRLGDRSAKPRRLANFLGEVQDPRTGAIQSLSERLAGWCATLKTEFDKASGLPPVTAQPQQFPSIGASATPTLSATGGDGSGSPSLPACDAAAATEPESECATAQEEEVTEDA